MVIAANAPINYPITKLPDYQIRVRADWMAPLEMCKNGLLGKGQ
jgi:hypothetical protein